MPLFGRKSETDGGGERSARNSRTADMVMDMKDVKARGGKPPPPRSKQKSFNAAVGGGVGGGSVGANGLCFDGAGAGGPDNGPQVWGGFSTSDVDTALLEQYWQAVQEKLKSARTSGGDNIVVVTRTRPFNKRELELGTTNCVRVIDKSLGGQQQVWVVNPAAPEAGPVKFSFDFCFDSFDPASANFIDQQTSFETVGLDLLAKTWAGFNRYFQQPRLRLPLRAQRALPASISPRLACQLKPL